MNPLEKQKISARVKQRQQDLKKLPIRNRVIRKQIVIEEEPKDDIKDLLTPKPDNPDREHPIFKYIP